MKHFKTKWLNKIEIHQMFGRQKNLFTLLRDEAQITTTGPQPSYLVGLRLKEAPSALKDAAVKTDFKFTGGLFCSSNAHAGSDPEKTLREHFENTSARH
jgi:hypothetical protein